MAKKIDYKEIEDNKINQMRNSLEKDFGLNFENIVVLNAMTKPSNDLALYRDGNIAVAFNPKYMRNIL